MTARKAKTGEEAEMNIRATYRDHEKAKGFERVQLACLLGRIKPKESPYRIALDASELYKLASSLSALAVAHCNYGLSPRQETREENMCKRVALIASWYGLTAQCSGDPRGYVVRLDGPGIVRNGMGDGFGVA